MAEGKEERRAELVLARLADTRLVMSSRALTKIVTVVLLVGQVVTGLWLRSLAVPDWQETAAACAFLLILALALPALFRRPRKKEPQWVRAAAVHERSLAGRIPRETHVMVGRLMKSMTGRRWQGAHLYVSRCTEEEAGEAHYAAGGTFVMGGRLLVILGEHLACGQAGLAAAVLGHERRHVTGWRMHAYALADIAGTWGLIVAGWAVPWPALLPVVAALRVAMTAVLWAIEISCDIGGGRDTSPAAMIATLDFKERAECGARALWPAGKRRAVSVLTWAAGQAHPPFRVRRAAIRRFCPETTGVTGD